MDNLLIAFLVTCLLVYLLKKIAPRLDLVDAPRGHKNHQGSIPVVGGIAIFGGFLVWQQIYHFNFTVFLVCAAILIVAGVWDDRKSLSVRVRMVVQVAAASIMAIWGGVVLYDLGEMFSGNTVMLGMWAVPFTIFTVVGGINAVNMSDGIDGLAGSLTLVTLSMLMLLAWYAGMDGELAVLLALAGAVMAFLVFNLRAPWRGRAGIFMGDAGSMFLGFALVWHMVLLSQGEHRAMLPVTALWLFALPLFDTVSIMVRRTLKGKSPFSPDREHFHHSLQAKGFTAGQSVVVTTLLAMVLALVGVIGYLMIVPEWIMFYGFLGLFVVYLLVMEYAWRKIKKNQISVAAIVESGVVPDTIANTPKEKRRVA